MFKRYTRYIKFFMIVIPIVTILLLLAANAPTQASSPTAPASVFTCTPNAVGVYANRIHVHCTTGAAPSASIFYFAVCNATDSALASRYLSVFTTAKVTGKNLTIFYASADTTSGPACSCLSSDCRLTLGAEVEP